MPKRAEVRAVAVFLISCWGCTQKTVVVGCKATAECGAKQVCVDNHCADPCNTSAECDGDRTCRNGVCESGPAPVALVRVVAEPAGANCPNGGSAVQAGVDNDRDGQLSDVEVTSTSYVCNAPEPESGSGVLQGNLMIFNQDDLTHALGYTGITGDLEIYPQGLTEVELPALTSLGGSLWVNGNDTLTSLSLPVLQSTGGDLWLSDQSALTTVSLPLLLSVGGSFEALNLPVLSTLNLPVLTSVSGEEVRLMELPALTQLSLPALSRVFGDIYIISLDVLPALSLPALDTVSGHINLGVFPVLTSLSFPLLTALPDSLYVGFVDSLVNLEGFANLEIVGGTLTVANTTGIQTLGFTSLRRVDGDLQLYGNSNLCTSVANALRDQVLNAEGIGGTTEISGNGPC
jgi:hypothetical protein